MTKPMQQQHNKKLRRSATSQGAARDRHQLDSLVEEAPLPDFEHGERRRTQGLILVYMAEHQAKGQFLTIAKRLLEMTDKTERLRSP